MSARGPVLLRLAREAIAEAFGEPAAEVPDEAWLRGALHGCVGQLSARWALARAAAFDDGRFPPLEVIKLAQVHVEVSVLSFGTVGCNLGCRFCQSWDISKATEWDTLAEQASPDAIVERAQALGCRSVAFTSNAPTISAECAIDVVVACRARGVKAVAVTAGYIHPAPLQAFAAVLDAANVDLKAFTEDFYRRITFAHLGPVLEMLQHLVHHAKVWTEITTLLIPRHNDSEAEVAQVSERVVQTLGPQVPLHVSGLHPDFKLRDVPGDAAVRAGAGARGGPPARVQRQRARRRGRHHVLCELPGAAHRATGTCCSTTA